MRNHDMGVEGLPDDLTPFITRTTQDHISGGAFGDVWKCNYNRDDISAVVAVKAFRYPDCDDSEDQKIIQKINREIGILKILRHENIVPLLGTTTGFGRRPELCSLVTPWLPNGTLNVYLASKHDDLTMMDRSRMLVDVSAGLRYLHSVHVVHGDITGANILIDEGGQAKLIDFGLSTIVLPLFGQSHLVATSIRPGAIRYAAPELLSDEVFNPPSKKIDIYSFGCVMLQILSGQHPWSEIKSELRVLRFISRGHSPKRPDGYPVIMDSDWDIIQKCLQYECELRPSADEVLDFVMHRRSLSDSSSLFTDSPDDAQDGFPGASSDDDSDDSDMTEHPPNSPPPHHEHELTNAIIGPQIQRSSSCLSLPSLDSTSSATVFGTACSSLQSLSDTDAGTVFNTACSSLRSSSTGSCSSLNTDSRPLPQILGTSPMRLFDTGSRVVRSTGVPGYEHRQSTPPPPPPKASNREQTRLRKRNIVIFGKTGSGKSSIINTIAQKQLAETSNDTYRCTSTTQRYQVEISGQKFVLIDTPGLDLGAAAKAENQLKNLLCELMNPRSDGIGLLVYCVHCTTPLRALVKAYTTFYSGICRENVPIVIVVTGLEKMIPMEDWWDTNWMEIESLDMHFADHACVTGLFDIFTHRITESSKTLRNLIVKNFSECVVDYSFSLANIPPREKTIVIFGNNGSGISSVINVIARKQLARTSCDAHGCTSTPQRYQVEISGHRFVLFDTASLNQGTEGTVTTAKAEKQLGSLLRKLMSSRSDEIGLLVYCMRTTTAPPTVAEAYNKFYSGICQKKVPIVLVVTGLEKETRMERWWDSNRKKFEGMRFAGHACITAIQMYPGIPDDYTRRVAESSDVLRDLIVNHYPDLVGDNRRFEQIRSTWTVTGMPIKRG